MRAPRLLRSYSTVRFNENFNQQAPDPKPKISQFKYPLYHTFLLASTAYMGFHVVWYHLEYKEVEKDLKEKAERLENEMQKALDEVRIEVVDSKPKRSWLTFWRNS